MVVVTLGPYARPTQCFPWRWLSGQRVLTVLDAPPLTRFPFFSSLRFCDASTRFFKSCRNLSREMAFFFFFAGRLVGLAGLRGTLLEVGVFLATEGREDGPASAVETKHRDAAKANHDVRNENSFVLVQAGTLFAQMWLQPETRSSGLKQRRNDTCFYDRSPLFGRLYQKRDAKVNRTPVLSETPGPQRRF